MHFITAAVSEPTGRGSAEGGTSTQTARSTRRVAGPTFTSAENGVLIPTLKVTDQFGRSASDYLEIIVANTPPVVEFVTPQHGDLTRRP